MPELLPATRFRGEWAQAAGSDVTASLEWLGDGRKSLRQLAFRRELAEVIVGTSSRDHALTELPVR